HRCLFLGPRSPWFGPAPFRPLSSSPALRAHESKLRLTVHGGRIVEPGIVFGSQTSPSTTSVATIGLGLAAHGLYRGRSNRRAFARMRRCTVPPHSQP